MQQPHVKYSVSPLSMCVCPPREIAGSRTPEGSPLTNALNGALNGDSKAVAISHALQLSAPFVLCYLRAADHSSLQELVNGNLLILFIYILIAIRIVNCQRQLPTLSGRMTGVGIDGWATSLSEPLISRGREVPP